MAVTGFQVEFYVNHELVDKLAGEADTSFGRATAFLGEGTGSTPGLAPAKYRFDEMSLVKDETEYLGNRGFESALAGSGTGLVFNNWNNVHPSRGSGRYSDIAYAGSWAGGINKPTGNGTYLIQDTTLVSGDFFDFQGQIYRSSDTPGSRVQFQVFFDWDRGGGDTSGEVGIFQQADGTVSYGAHGVGQGGFPGLVYDTWTHWRIRFYSQSNVWQTGSVAFA